MQNKQNDQMKKDQGSCSTSAPKTTTGSCGTTMKKEEKTGSCGTTDKGKGGSCGS
jgi:hypothetical protein